MSIIKQLIPQCDVCNETFPDFIDKNNKTLRKIMKNNGWRNIYNKDVCPKCCEAFGEKYKTRMAQKTLMNAIL